MEVESTLLLAHGSKAKFAPSAKMSRNDNKARIEVRIDAAKFEEASLISREFMEANLRV